MEKCLCESLVVDQPRKPFQLALDCIYTENESEFRCLLETFPSILSEKDGPWYLIHHLFRNFWESGINIYIFKGGQVDYLTDDYVSSIQRIKMFMTGGQSILHILASNKLDNNKLEIYKNLYPNLNIRDFNDCLPDDILNAENTIANHQTQAKKVAERTKQKLIERGQSEWFTSDIIPSVEITGKLCDDIMTFSFSDSFRDDLIAQINSLNESIPNSMHRKGKLLLPNMSSIIYSIVKTLFMSSSIDISGGIVRLHAFYVSYGSSAQTSLATHVDDSSYSINMCLTKSSSGDVLIFDDLGLVYDHSASHGILHKGHLKHHVCDLTDGYRENIIIWVTLAS